MALQSGWKMYSCSCSIGLGEKQLLLFVSFFLWNNVYFLHMPLNLGPLYTLKMPNLLNLKKLRQNRKKKVHS